MRRATRSFALVVALAAGAAGVQLAVPPTAGGAGAGSIIDFIRLAGDRVVVVPNGTYTAGPVLAPHPATDGPLKGWLVLEAQSLHGVVVDLTGAKLELQAGTSRVLFVGFKFVNGSIEVKGQDLRFWYTDHSFPADVWAAQAPDRSRPELGYYRAPRAIYANSASTRGVRFLGSDIHDTGTGVTASNSTDLLLRGVRMWAFSDKGLDPNDVVHPDAIGAVAGRSTRLTVRDSSISGRVMLIDAPGTNLSAGGPHQNLLFVDSWFRSSPSAGFTFTSRKTTTPRGIFGTRLRVRSWGHKSGWDRIEIVDGKGYYLPRYNVTPRIRVADQWVARAAPAPGTPSPAGRWRAEHPYESWLGAIG
jgi:hypothetical protein